MSFSDEFLELMPATIIAQPGARDGLGKWVSSGAALSIRCRIESERMLVRDASGREVVSSSQCYCNGDNNLTPDKHVITLPVGYEPRTELTPLGIGKEQDEEGDHHEVVFLP